MNVIAPNRMERCLAMLALLLAAHGVVNAQNVTRRAPSTGWSWQEPQAKVLPTGDLENQEWRDALAVGHMRDGRKIDVLLGIVAKLDAVPEVSNHQQSWWLEEAPEGSGTARQNVARIVIRHFPGATTAQDRNPVHGN